MKTLLIFSESVASPTVENMLCQLEISGKQHPFLQLMLMYEPMLRLPSFLWYFLQWYNVTVRYSRYQLTRNERKTLSISQFIMRIPEKELLWREFDTIQEHWNKLPTLLKGLERLGFNIPDFELETLSDETKVEQCMVTDENSTLMWIIFYLARAQNTFIDEVLKLDSESASSGSRFLQNEHGRSFIQRVPLLRLKQSHIFQFELEEYLSLSQALPFTGQGDEILYDFWKIEADATVRLLEGKAYIDLPQTMIEVQFKDDLFSKSAFLLNDIRSMIPQSSLSHDVEYKLRNSISRDRSLSNDLLTAVGILLSFVCQSTENYGSDNKRSVRQVERSSQFAKLRRYRCF